jgi:hypothetical protein
MRKSRTLRPVIAAQRVDKPLHDAIKAAAETSGRTLAEELAALARQALDHRSRFESSATASAIEMATIGFLLAGERCAQDHGVTQPWPTDLGCRREAALAACAVLVTHFVSADAGEQALTVEALKGRIWTDIANRPKRGEGKTS